MTPETLLQITNLVQPIIMAIIGWAVAKFLHAKTTNETANSIIGRLGDIVTTVVGELEQTMVKELKAMNGVGILTKGDADKLKAAAVAKVKSYLGPDGVVLLLRAFGLDEAGLNSLIGGKVEATVFKMNTPVPALPPFLPAEKLPPFLAGNPKG